jgi:hypothetical protein
MRFNPIVRAIPVLFLLAALSGCFRYEESITIGEDGKGTASYTMSRPKRGVVDKLSPYVHNFDNRFEPETATQNLPAGITTQPVRRTEVNERIEISADYSFTDAAAFATLASGTPSPFNNVSITRSNDTLIFTRRFSVPDRENMERVQKFGTDVALVFKLTGPGSLKSHNGTRVDGNTVVWELKAPELFANGGKTFNAEFHYGRSYMPWIIAGIVLFLLIDTIIIFKLLKKRLSP